MDEQALRELMQPMLQRELMRSWREGVRDGLKMARRMAEAVRGECDRRYSEASSDEERRVLAEQIALVSGEIAALTTAAEEATNPRLACTEEQ